MALLKLSLSYVALLFLLLLLVLRLKVPTWFRMMLIVIASAFYLFHFQSLRALSGWPSSDLPPEKFDVIGTRVIEPDPRIDEPGRIELWIRQPGFKESRLLVRPYSRGLHDNVRESNRNRANGRAQQGRSVAPSSGGADGNSGIEISNKPPLVLPNKK